MSHGLTRNSGMFAMKMPWHKHESCKVLEKAPSVDEGKKLAQQDWMAVKERLFLKDGRQTNTFAIIREDTKKILTFTKSVGPKYHILQNGFLWEKVRPLVESNQVSLETAGCLFGGRKVWIMCKLNRPPVEIVKGDDVVKYLLFSNSHDGSTCVRVGFTMVEVVCANTLHAAHSDTASELVRIRHSKDVETNVSNLVDTVNTVDAQMEANAAQMRLLTKKDINQKDLEKYIKEVFKMEEKENEDGTLCLATRTKNNLKEIMGLYHKNLQAHLTEKFESGPNSTGPARGTLWNAYGAISEYLTHKRGRGGENMDTKLDSLWFGSSSQLNKRAFELALAMAM